ncbi:mannitol dehydrogenase family protein [Sphingomonas panacisoli]|uniref:Mannitol dehydrogenase family protein n=1 Tax=Sphingomonas panacisoli TaxID=1813879 RepID=A0A5B8LHU2_9SPHN|nr:mannitol dehydrogenase family protein [Sphingomonas panacisoli]QDZ07877.1 mannitol dehydrogenase family protein [Sphingomonas panacisoli]
MKRLSRAVLGSLPAAIDAPRERGPITTGIVHFGASAFHRAHQADYIDRLLDRDPRWGIAAVSLRTRGTVDALAAQDGLYTLAIRDVEPSLRVIGAHTQFLGPDDADATRALLAAPETRLITTTVTEKGYCMAADGTLDFGHPDIIHDLARPAVPASVIGWIAAGLTARRRAGGTPFVVMPCDNLASNGAKVRAAIAAFARELEPALADWIDDTLRVPATMVDSITPSSDDRLFGDVAGALGVEDRAAVQRERFAQWVIEDVGDIGPDLAIVGATVTGDVGGYERAKLRILNGAHSTLAYAGLLRGHTTVAEAMRDGELAGFVDAMIRQDIIPTLPPVPGLDLHTYADDVLRRFANPAIVHRLDQIAQDGSQKLPYRLGDTLIVNRRKGRMPLYVVRALGSWVAFLVKRARDNVEVVDPLSNRLRSLASDADPAALALRLAASGIGIPGEMANDATFVDALGAASSEALQGAALPEVAI